MFTFAITIVFNRDCILFPMVDINISWKTFSYQGLNISQRTLSQFLSFDVYRLCVRLLHVSDNVWICFTGLTEMCKKEYVISDAWPGISCNEGIYIYISLDSCILYSIWILISLNYICQNIFFNSRSLLFLLTTSGC